MRPKTVRLSAAGFSVWLPLDYRNELSQAVAVDVRLSSGASLTYDVEHTFDSLQEPVRDFSLSRTTTTATVTRTTHGLSVGDNVLMSNCGAPFDGSYAVASVVDANNFTYTVANSGATSLLAGLGRMTAARVADMAEMAALTASASASYLVCPRGVRLNVTTYSSGFAELTVMQGG